MRSGCNLCLARLSSPLYQFKDKNVQKFTYTKTGEDGDDKIDAISGATITTNAVTNAVDSALVYFQNELGGGVNE